MKADDLLLHEKVRGEIYRLLSECYLLPDENQEEKLINLKELLADVCEEAVNRTPMEGEKIPIDQLKLDYSRLFVGPYKLLAPPYGSVYLEGEGTLMGNSTLDVRNRYREAGLDTSENHKEAPDHISAELEFMYYLIFKEVESIGKSDLEDAEDYLERQKRFLEDHLGAWVSEFADRVEENAETEFYKNLATATKLFVKKDIEKTNTRHVDEGLFEGKIDV